MRKRGATAIGALERSDSGWRKSVLEDARFKDGKKEL